MIVQEQHREEDPGRRGGTEERKTKEERGKQGHKIT
jgi:hypothetical protein